MIRNNSFLEALSTPEAKEALIVGIAVLIRTGNLDNALKALVVKAAENGTLTGAGLAAIEEILRWIWEILQGRR